jgi:putative PIN family toxin of toxin-antitoxin system
VIIILDTNVLISGLLSSDSPPAMMLNLIARGDVRTAYDDRILDEYSDVLNRDEFGFGDIVTGFWLSYIRSSGLYIIAAPLNLELPDPDDEKFVEVAAASDADALVTGNLRHYNARAKRKARIVSPGEFISSFCGE